MDIFVLSKRTYDMKQSGYYLSFFGWIMYLWYEILLWDIIQYNDTGTSTLIKSMPTIKKFFKKINIYIYIQGDTKLIGKTFKDDKRDHCHNILILSWIQGVSLQAEFRFLFITSAVMKISLWNFQK